MKIEEKEREMKHIGYMKILLNVAKEEFPDMEEDVLKEKIKNIVKDNMKNPKAMIDDRETTLLGLDKFIVTEKPIITGFGSMYLTHDKFDNLLAKLVEYIIKTRKVYKNKMFEHVNDDDQTLRNMYDMYQRTMKILANSFYGSLIQSSFILYNPISGPSVTYSGVDIITTALNNFEKFLANNIYFRNVDDIIVYMNNIKSENYSMDKVKFKQSRSKDQIIDYLFDKTDNYMDEDRILLMTMMNNYTDEDLLKLYYKNNFIDLLKESDIADNYFKEILSCYEFTDPNDPPAKVISTNEICTIKGKDNGKIKVKLSNGEISLEDPSNILDYREKLDNLWNIIRNIVFYNYQDFYRMENSEERLRKTVLVVNV
ncbi:hypothetical protein FPHOBKDP_00122 [Listeria phage LPJP1]|nr:hypothetical protein FPHOBKDP_00122 [Listeria phage LPJP1]